MKKLLPLIVVLFAACQKETLTSSSINGQVSNDVTVIKTKTITPFEFFAFNECTQEWAKFTGQYEVDVRNIENENGTHEGGKLRYLNTVVIGQTTGNEYKLIGQSNYSDNNPENSGFNFRVRSRLTLSTKEGSDWVVSSTAQIVTNNTGIVVIRSEETSYCK